jgi:hypothetical protein
MARDGNAMARSRHGLEAAQVVRGHSNATITAEVHPEVDQAAALRVAAETG